ncbi:MAG TPA: VOC family protein [Verrucomicrobium sp.]|nr:VOC family protein [Verrucomicrobium sp.]
MEETLAFYSTVLGFTVTMHTPEYSIVDRDGATVHFMKAADESVMQALRGHVEIYIEVENIDPFWRHVQTFTGKYKIKELTERDYGMLEFIINDPNDCLVFVGQPTNRG